MIKAHIPSLCLQKIYDLWREIVCVPKKSWHLERVVKERYNFYMWEWYEKLRVEHSNRSGVEEKKMAGAESFGILTRMDLIWGTGCWQHHWKGYGEDKWRISRNEHRTWQDWPSERATPSATITKVEIWNYWVQEHRQSIDLWRSKTG